MDLENIKSKLAFLKTIEKEKLINSSLALVIIFLLIIYFFSLNKSNTDVRAKSTSQTSFSFNKVSDENKILLDIEGAVINPGVYEMYTESRLNDLIIAAGGFHKDVDYKYISQKLNKAEKLKDAAKIYIPFKDELPLEITNAANSGSSISASTETEEVRVKININTSTKEELDELPGIGEVNAENIVNSRPYNTIEELLEKKIVTQTRFDNIKELIEV